MSAAFVTGDLFNHPGLDALAHGCNCAGAMGKGIAVEFKKRWPDMFTEYKKRCDAGTFRPGGIFQWKVGGLTIFNLGTEQHWRTGAELPAIEASTLEMVKLAEAEKVQRIGLPRLGAGLGGLAWGDVRGLLERLGAATAVELVVFEQFAPKGAS
jgi:O-acetyl-ADP-ribose deacetylase (regulator of RNase III)